MLICFVCSCGFNSQASDFQVSVSHANQVPPPSSEIIGLLDLIFTGHGEVYDSQNNIITDEFITKYYYLFDKKDYQTIMLMCFSEHISQLVGDPIVCVDTKQTGTKAVETRSYYQERFTLVTQHGFPYDGKSWYIFVAASGTMTVGYAYPNIVVIQSVTNPVFSYSFYGEGSAFTGSVTNNTPSSPVISSSGTYFTFHTTTTHKMTGPGLSPLESVTLGPFTNTFYYQIYA